jgi:Domain of unknown function (DUF4516)
MLPPLKAGDDILKEKNGGLREGGKKKAHGLFLKSAQRRIRKEVKRISKLGVGGKESTKMGGVARKFGGGKSGTGTPSLAWSSVVVVASLLAGASIVHYIYKPDLVSSYQYLSVAIFVYVSRSRKCLWEPVLFNFCIFTPIPMDIMYKHY